MFPFIPGRTARRGAALLLLVLLAPAFGRAQDPRDLRAFLTRLETAANKGDVAALQAESLPGAQTAFDWAVAPGGMFSRPQPWRTYLLQLPGAEGRENGSFVAFSRYQVSESKADHLYRLALTPGGPRLRAEVPETDTGGYRVRDHRLAVRFDVPRRRVNITDRVLVERHANSSRANNLVHNVLPAVVLRLNTVYTVSSVKRDGAVVPFKQAGGFVAVPFPNAPRAAFELAYSATVTGSNEDYIKPREAALTAYWYPHTGRLPATHAVQITVPRGWTAIGQGEPTGKKSEGSETTFGWKNALPVCYFTVAAGRYTVTTRKVDGLAISAYLLHANEQRAAQAIDTAAGAIRWYGKNFSPYPYTRYAVVESDTFPPALECYSFTLAGRGLIPGAIVHEVSHTWWGGVVPNTYTRSLWNESFAEYSDGLYQRQTGPAGMHQVNRQMMAGMSAVMGRVSLMQARDAMDMSEAAVGYGKGGMVLENLERMLGLPKMLASIRRFIERHPRGEAAEWPDFVAAVQETAGPEWAAYFPPWLERTDLPTLRLQDVQTARSGNKWVVTGTVAQNEPAFWIQVPVIVETEDGDARREVDLKGPAASFRVETSTRPKQVRLDPQGETMRAGTKKAALPSLMALQTASGPLLAVYATGGTPEETAVARAVAESQAAEALPFAEVTVKADTEADADALAAANVLLLGRPESLRLPVRWLEALPLRYTADGIALDGKAWKGRDLWGLAVLPHPDRPRGLLAHAAGVGPEALRNFRRQGDLESGKALFVVQGEGRPLAAESPLSMDPTVVSLTP